jgi:PIN domain nuclease of toxin-antitoxin system
MRRYILDACALIAVLNDEPGREVVEGIVNRPDADVCMHAINLLEVYYDTYRCCGPATADDFLRKFQDTPVTVINEFSDSVFREAGRLKATYRISLADAIALAEAGVTDSALLTCDHHEFDAVSSKENILFYWIR